MTTDIGKMKIGLHLKNGAGNKLVYSIELTTEVEIEAEIALASIIGLGNYFSGREEGSTAKLLGKKWKGELEIEVEDAAHSLTIKERIKEYIK